MIEVLLRNLVTPEVDGPAGGHTHQVRHQPTEEAGSSLVDNYVPAGNRQGGERKVDASPEAGPDSHGGADLGVGEGVTGVHLRGGAVREGGELGLEGPARLGVRGVEDRGHRTKVSVRFEKLHMDTVLGAEGLAVDCLMHCLPSPCPRLPWGSSSLPRLLGWWRLKPRVKA